MKKINISKSWPSMIVEQVEIKFNDVFTFGTAEIRLKGGKDMDLEMQNIAALDEYDQIAIWLRDRITKVPKISYVFKRAFIRGIYPSIDYESVAYKIELRFEKVAIVYGPIKTYGIHK